MVIKIIADSPEPDIFKALTSKDTDIPATSMYPREQANEIKKYDQTPSSKKRNTPLVQINPI